MANAVGLTELCDVVGWAFFGGAGEGDDGA